MKNPFIAGNWVRGEHFFGRQELVREILEGRRHYMWVAGTRRFGKTSLLKQVEYLAREGEAANQYLTVFWDMQGSQDAAGLKESLLEGIEDNEDRFEDVGVGLDELEELELFAILRTLRRKTREAGLCLMFLCDETEELINVQNKAPELLPKLRRFFQRGENVYTVLTATRRLSLLEQTSLPNTSPFLSGFVPPVYLPRLEESEARRLVLQWPFKDEEVEEILIKSDHHPYLIQLICRRLIEMGDLKRVIEEVSHDDMISHFFSVDFQYLGETEKELLLHLLQSKRLTLQQLRALVKTQQEKLVKLLYELVQTGMVKQVDGAYAISNYFFEQWLWRERENLFSQSQLRQAQPTRSIVQPSEPPRLPRLGEVLGGHEVLEKIGTGGMGVVFKGRDVKLDRLVALKVLSPGLMSDTDFKQRFLREAQAASALNHQNICTIYQIGEHRGLMFISMELVDGLTLRGWMESGERSLADRLHVATEAARGLAYAHRKGIVHRDIKSENIMISHEGDVKVMDFGLAKIQHKADVELTKTGTTMGTLAYMSPEQVSGLAVDHRSDIFSFGVVLYELFGERLPFVGEYELSIMYAILNEEPEPLHELNPEVPEGLAELVHTALQKDPANRFENMDVLVQQLERLA